MFQTLKYFPAKIIFMDGEVLGIFLFGIAGLLWVLVPFLDRKGSQGERSRVVTYVGLGVIVYIVILTILGWLA